MIIIGDLAHICFSLPYSCQMVTDGVQISNGELKYH